MKIIGILLYNIGRSVTYGILGLFIGIIGAGFSLAGLQKWVSIIMGVIMISIVLFPSISNSLNSKTNNLPFISFVKSKLGLLFKSKNVSALFAIGLLNGLLPCGLVYMALAGALATGGLVNSILFMVLFGLGTTPLMFLVSFAGGIISLGLRKQINKIIPVLVVVIGLLFIIRGLGLGIPFLSPNDTKLHIQPKEIIQEKADTGSCPSCK
jgi:sulfite exporter TauE/SafE